MRVKKRPAIYQAAEATDRRSSGPTEPCSHCGLRERARFLQLNVELRSTIARLLKEQSSVPERAEIVKAGRPADLFTLYEGWACRHVTLPDGRRQITNFHLPGDMIGLDGAVRGEAGYSVVMLTSGVVCSFPPGAVATLLEARPELAKHLLASAMAEIGALEQRVVALGRRNAVERIAFQLLELYVRLDAINRTARGSRSCSFPLTQRHLADATGLTPTHVNNTLQQLRRDGVVSLAGKLLTIHDLPRLRTLAGAGEPTLAPCLLF